MKKRECAIVQDLLVLYEDGVLQEESMQMIEEHIRGCEECMRIYENTGKKLPISGGEEEASEKEQEDASAKVMRKLSKNLFYKNAVIFGVVVAVLLIGTVAVNEICNHYLYNGGGIAGMFYTIPADKIEVTELYQLKNGDIYCTLKSEKPIGVQWVSDWILPNDEIAENTENAVQEIGFRQKTLWEWDTSEYNQVSVVFATSRQGVLEESREKIVQRCSEISYYGKTAEDKKILWQRGQAAEEAPEEIERRAIEEYVRDGQVGKAVQECENLGWDSEEEIAKVYQEDHDISRTYYDSTYTGENVLFQHDYDAVWSIDW